MNRKVIPRFDSDVLVNLESIASNPYTELQNSQTVSRTSPLLPPKSTLNRTLNCIVRSTILHVFVAVLGHLIKEAKNGQEADL